MKIYVHLKDLERRYGADQVQAELRKALNAAVTEYDYWKHGDRAYPILDSCGEVIGWVNPPQKDSIG